MMDRRGTSGRASRAEGGSEAGAPSVTGVGPPPRSDLGPNRSPAAATIPAVAPPKTVCVSNRASGPREDTGQTYAQWPSCPRRVPPPARNHVAALLRSQTWPSDWATQQEDRISSTEVIVWASGRTLRTAVRRAAVSRASSTSGRRASLCSHCIRPCRMADSTSEGVFGGAGIPREIDPQRVPVGRADESPRGRSNIAPIL